MAIYSYRLARGQTRWQFIIDLPPAADGRRRQMNRKGFVSQEAALAAETEARKAYAGADLAAELENWLRERELDLRPTTLSNYCDIIGYIKPHLGARHAYTLEKRAIHDLYLTLLKRGSKRGGPLARETVRTVHRVLMKALNIVTGMRRGELAGLKWSCVDLEANLYSPLRLAVPADHHREGGAGAPGRAVAQLVQPPPVGMRTAARAQPDYFRAAGGRGGLLLPDDDRGGLAVAASVRSGARLWQTELPSLVGWIISGTGADSR